MKKEIICIPNNPKGKDNHITRGGKGRYSGSDGEFESPGHIGVAVYLGKGFKPLLVSKVTVTVEVKN